MDIKIDFGAKLNGDDDNLRILKRVTKFASWGCLLEKISL